MKIIRYKHDLDFSYAFGATLTIELLKNKAEVVRRVFLKSNIRGTEPIKNILDMCDDRNIEVVQNDKIFNVLSPKDNCFVIAEFEKFYQKTNREKSNIVLVNPSDAGNIGTIIRTAVGLGFNDIVIIKPAVDVFDPKAVRASMGAMFHANIEYFENIDDYLKSFPEHNRYAFMLDGNAAFEGLKIKEPFSLLFGNEASGLPDEYANFCLGVKIGQTSNIDSFSLPMAAGIAMYEAKKVRG